MWIVIAEDQVLLREGLARLFEDGGHRVAASRGDARDLLATVAGHTSPTSSFSTSGCRPPSPTRTRAAHEIKQAQPDTGVLLLSQHIETTHGVDLVGLGGFGYLLKDRVLAVAEFLDAAERVARGGSALDPQVVSRLLGHGSARDELAHLSEREREVLSLMAEGLTNTGIAERLFLSERTIEAHVRHVLLKLQIPETEHDHRRVLAVVAHVSATATPR